MLNKKESASKNLVKDMAKYLPSQIVPVIMGLITVPIVTRLFSPKDYGNYVLVMATISILSPITTGWLNNSIIRFFPFYEKEKKLDEFYNTLIKLIIVSVGAVSVLLLGILSLSKDIISANFKSLMYVGLLVFIVTSCSSMLLTFLRAKGELNWYTFFTIWYKIVGLGLGLTMVILFRYGVSGLLLGSFLSMVVTFPFLWKFATKESAMSIRRFSFPMSHELAKYGFPLVIGFLTSWILSLSDRYILEIFRSSQEVGIYSASYNISEHSIFMLSSLFILASGPISMNIWEKEGREASQVFLTKFTKYYLLICLPATVGLSVLARPIINIMVAPAYYPGYRIVPLVAFGAFLSTLAYGYAIPLMWRNKTHIWLVCSTGPALLNIILNVLLVPRYGYVAAAITTLICYSVYLFLMVNVSKRFLIWKYPFRFMGKVAGASVVMGVVVYYIGNSLTSSVLINLVVAISVGVIVYSLVLFLLGGFQANEIKSLLVLGRKIIRH